MTENNANIPENPYNDFSAAPQTPAAIPPQPMPAVAAPAASDGKKTNYLYAIAGFAAATILVMPTTWFIASNASSTNSPTAGMQMGGGGQMPQMNGQAPQMNGSGSSNSDGSNSMPTPPSGNSDGSNSNTTPDSSSNNS